MIKKFFRDNPIHEKIANKFDLVFIFPFHHLFIVWGLIVLGISSAYHYLLGFPHQPLFFGIKDLILFFSSAMIYFSVIALDSLSNKGQNSLNILLFPDMSSLSNKLSNYVKLMQLICILLGSTISWLVSLIYILFILVSHFNLYTISDKKNWFLDSFLFYSISLGILFYSIGWFFILSKSNFDILPSLIVFIKSIYPYIAVFFAISLVIYKSELDFNNIYDVKNISTISAIIILFVIIASWTLKDPVLTVASIVSLPFYIYGIVRKTENDLVRMLRYSVFLFSFFPLTFYPLLSIAFIFNFYFCKYYFWHRYKIHFPAFAID